MCRNRADVSAGADLFSPDAKCCTYWPQLPNYLVGAILTDTGASQVEGRRRLAAMLEREWTSPLGVGPSAEYRILYAATGKKDFGRSAGLLCPFFTPADGGTCTIWQQRNGVCSTWFCKLNRGIVGQTFWEGCQALLTSVEKSISVWCALELGLSSSIVRAALLKPADTALHESQEEAATGPWWRATEVGQSWGRWVDQRSEFFMQCHRLVGDLTWSDVARIGGVEVEMQARHTRNCMKRLLDPALPDRLTTGRMTVVSRSLEFAMVSSYRRTDPQMISEGLLHVLRRFDGQDLREALASIQEEEGVELTEDLIRSLVDFGILVPAGKRASAG
jgi:hypothetical protein